MVDGSVLTGGVEIVVGTGKVDVSKVVGGIVVLGIDLVGREVVGDEVVVGIDFDVVEVVVDGIDKVVLGVLVVT